VAQPRGTRAPTPILADHGICQSKGREGGVPPAGSQAAVSLNPKKCANFRRDLQSDENTLPEPFLTIPWVLLLDPMGDLCPQIPWPTMLPPPSHWIQTAILPVATRHQSSSSSTNFIAMQVLKKTSGLLKSITSGFTDITHTTGIL